jgi:hypothetical protein
MVLQVEGVADRGSNVTAISTGNKTIRSLLHMNIVRERDGRQDKDKRQAI